MNLFEAKHILKSVGYTLGTEQRQSTRDEIRQLLEHMETRGQTHTKEYKFLSEMAFAKKANDPTYNDETEKLRNLINGMQSLKSRKGEITPAKKEEFEEKFNAIDLEKAGQFAAAKKDINALRAYFADPTAEFNTGSKNNTGINTGDFETDCSRITASISTLKTRGTGNVNDIKARIDELNPTTPEEKIEVKKLYRKLAEAEANVSSARLKSGLTLLFTPSVNPARIAGKLRAIKAEYTIEEDGTFTITSNVKRAKETLEGLGEFIASEADERTPRGNLVTATYNVADAEWFLDVVERAGANATDNGDGTYTVKCGAPKMALLTSMLEEEKDCLVPDEV